MSFDAQVTLMTIMIAVGLCVGSFLNVVAIRFLRGQDWVKLRSTCFSCGKELSFSQNLPVWGWLSNGGRSRCCREKLPLRYLMVELFCGILAAVSLYQLGLTLTLIFSLFFMANIIIFLTDLEGFIIPDFASLGGAGVGVILILADVDGLPSFSEAVTGGALGFGLLYAINAAYKLWRGHDGLGFGDVKLLLMYGIWLGPTAILPILFLSSLAGAVLGIVLTLLNKSPLMETNAKQFPVLPYGCFLVAAALRWVLFNEFFALPIHITTS